MPVVPTPTPFTLANNLFIRTVRLPLVVRFPPTVRFPDVSLVIPPPQSFLYERVTTLSPVMSASTHVHPVEYAWRS